MLALRYLHLQDVPAPLFGTLETAVWMVEAHALYRSVGFTDAAPFPDPEIGCHPGYAGHGFESSYLREREAEVRTLCDPLVPARLDELGILLTSFAELSLIAGDGSP